MLKIWWCLLVILCIGLCVVLREIYIELTKASVVTTNEIVTTNKNQTIINEIIVYTKDNRTGLCFASIGSFSTITCVPCDSLKNVEVK